tara:strand:- start:6269 stop:6790 length:522 start_codon:yes stop_codon:yes gene_type:complete
MDIIFDIDGTLLDITHRLHFIKKKPKDWASFRDPKQKRWDEPIMPIINIATALNRVDGNRLIFASGRSEEERLDTVRSLSRWFLLEGWDKIFNPADFGEMYEDDPGKVPWHPLYMRAEKDRREDTVVKKELYERMLEDGYKPELTFDDRPSVLRMWRTIPGLKVVDVGEGKEF